jgi:hypothetical protein
MSKFFHASRWHKWHHMMVSHFFHFLKKLRLIWDPHEMITHENPRSRPGSADSHFFLTCLVKKWHAADPKLIFIKNHEVYFLALKSKTTPIPVKSAGTCTKLKKYLQRLSQQNESWYVYPKWSTIYGGCFPQLSISRFGSCFTKKPVFGTQKMEKALFVVRNENWPPWRSSLSQGPRACPIWPRADKLCHAHGRILLI